MATQTERTVEQREPLSRERVLRAAVDLADRHGIDAVSMRKVGQELGVEAMSLYNHVDNKEDLLDGMTEIVVGEIDLELRGDTWKTQMRNRILDAREVMKRHPWASGVIESRRRMMPNMMRYMDGFAGIFFDNGFSMALAHHGLHALGSRMLGFSQELYDDSDAMAESPEVAAVMMQQMIERYPNISRIVAEITHDDDSVVGTGCDDDFEFFFALDLLLDGLDRLKQDADSHPG